MTTESSAIERPRAAPARPRVPPTRNLVIVFQPGWQDPQDWVTIGDHVRRIEPGIGVYVVACDQFNEEISARAAQLPSLVFSPGPLAKWANQRGKRYHGSTIDKFSELQRLAAGGVQVPRTAILRPDTVLDPKIWGPLVVLKPTDHATSSTGRGFQLIRTERVAFKPPQAYPEKHPGRRGPMMVQQFVDTGDHIRCTRVLMLFGEPLYVLTATTEEPRVDLDADDATIESAKVAHQAFPKRHREWRYDADAVAIARRAHAAMPEVPLKGVDVVRDVRTGRLFVLEVNPSSNSWHFSSQFLASQRAELGAAYFETMLGQLDAFGTSAHVLAERTVLEAE